MPCPQELENGDLTGIYQLKPTRQIELFTVIQSYHSCFENASQPTTASNVILKDCVNRLKKPNLVKAYIRSDNAGFLIVLKESLE